MPASRISWEKFAIDIADTASLRSEDPHHKVGACALNHQNMVVGVGYNGLASGKDVSPEFWEDRDARRPYMIHAEANCLSLCKKGEIRLLAVTLLPCSYCATLIASYGVQKVVYLDTYHKDDKAFEILSFYGIQLQQRSH
jgi:dCMP deaminase